ncbi:MAG: hypothetical protein JSW43_10260 [Gemmatimonadota bacterium]|nr:MAG: hypothetical protein JSW43_10260 [Gemmatimonadota bacterium]
MMSQLDLRQLERKAWQLYHQDGLVEVFLGLLLLLAFLAGIAGEYRFYLYIPMLLMGPAIILAKRMITVPRMGQVKFGPARRAKLRNLRLLAVLVFALTIALLIVTLRGSAWVREYHVLLSFGLGALIALLFAAVAHWKDFPRLYLVGLIVGTAFTLTELLDSPLPMLVAGGAVLAVGLVILVSFLRKYPLPAPGPGTAN